MYYIAVAGGASCDAGSASLAEEVGLGIALRGGILVCGGGGGIMKAAARGACNGGGMVLGLLPGDDPRGGNSYLTISVATGLGEARNAVIGRTADAVIAVDGEYGTLSEIALALKMGKPVVGLQTWSIKAPRGKSNGIICCSSADEAVEEAWRAIGRSEAP